MFLANDPIWSKIREADHRYIPLHVTCDPESRKIPTSTVLSPTFISICIPSNASSSPILDILSAFWLCSLPICWIMLSLRVSHIFPIQVSHPCNYGWFILKLTWICSMIAKESPNIWIEGISKYVVKWRRPHNAIYSAFILLPALAP